MGHLVELAFARNHGEGVALDAILRAAPSFSGFDPVGRRYYFRGPGRADDGDPTPDVEVWFDERGLYCNFLGGDAPTTRGLRDHLLGALGARFGQIREIF